MSEQIQLQAIHNIPYIDKNADIGQTIVDAASANKFAFAENDVLCIASKAVSIAEGRSRSLADVKVSEVASTIHARVPRKDPRTIQLIIDETGAPDGSRIDISDNFIGGWLPNGLRLTSSGVDKSGPEDVILLPKDADASAHSIGRTILEATGVNVAVIITDSDGRVDKRGATQVAIGIYGMAPIRVTDYQETDKVKKNEETTCDMLAASAGLIMGQRGTNKPVVLIRGHQYEFDKSAKITDALVKSNALPSIIEKIHE